MDISKSKQSIFNEFFFVKLYVDVREYTITELKDKEYKEPSVTKEVPSYFNILEYRRDILDRLNVTCEQACMATPQDKYYNALLNTLDDDNNCKGKLLSAEKLRQAVGKVMKEIEAEFKRSINKITCDNSSEYPMQKKDVSTINDSEYYASDDQVKNDK